MRVMWWGWLRCRYVLGSSLEPGLHHYSPAADDTDPLSNLSPGADRGRLPLHRMPDWYSPHPPPHVLNLHPLSSLIHSLFFTTQTCYLAPSLHMHRSRTLRWQGALPQRNPSFKCALFLFHTHSEQITLNKLIHKWVPLAVQSVELKS